MDRLTADQVYAATPPARGQAIIWDGEVSGFGLRVTAGGSKNFILNYRFADPNDRRKSNQYRFTIGPAKTAPRAAGWSVDEARKEASRWSKLIDRGGSHPLAERRGRDDAVKAARGAETFREAVADYIEHEQKGRKGNATADEVERAITKDCAAWLDRPVKDITAAEIGNLLRQIRDGKGKEPPKPYMANRLFSYLRAFLMWCSTPDVQKVAASPMVGMRKPVGRRRSPRSRFHRQGIEGHLAGGRFDRRYRRCLRQGDHADRQAPRRAQCNALGRNQRRRNLDSPNGSTPTQTHQAGACHSAARAGAACHQAAEEVSRSECKPVRVSWSRHTPLSRLTLGG